MCMLLLSCAAEGWKDAHASEEMLLSFDSDWQHPLSLAGELLSSARSSRKTSVRIAEFCACLCSSAPVLLCDLQRESRAPAREVPGGADKHWASPASAASQCLAGWS